MCPASHPAWSGALGACIARCNQLSSVNVCACSTTVVVPCAIPEAFWNTCKSLTCNFAAHGAGSASLRVPCPQMSCSHRRRCVLLCFVKPILGNRCVRSRDVKTEKKTKQRINAQILIRRVGVCELPCVYCSVTSETGHKRQNSPILRVCTLTLPHCKTHCKTQTNGIALLLPSL